MRKSILYFVALIYLLPSVLFANELLIKDDLACQNGDGEKCSFIASVFYIGEGFPYAPKGDIVKAVEYYQKACDLNLAGSCTFAGMIYYLDKEIQQDIKKSRVLLSKGCALGDDLGCSYLKSDIFKEN